MNPTCTNTCDAELPVVSFDNCNPLVAFSEIRKIRVGKSTSASFLDWTQAAEWISRISETSVTGDDYIRELTVIADKPLPTSVEKEISNGRKKVIGKDHVINFTVDDISQENYEFMRAMECGGKYKIWYEDEGTYVYGGNDGIVANMKLDYVANRGREEIGQLQGVITWRSKFSPERAISPIYDGDSSPSVPLTFDTSLTFASSTSDVDAGITGTAAVTDADTQFDFNAISPRVGSPMTMTIKVAGTTRLTVDFPSDYVGQYFLFTDPSAVEHTGNFVNGTIDF